MAFERIHLIGILSEVTLEILRGGCVGDLSPIQLGAGPEGNSHAGHHLEKSYLR